MKTNRKDYQKAYRELYKTKLNAYNKDWIRCERDRGYVIQYRKEIKQMKADFEKKLIRIAQYLFNKEFTKTELYILLDIRPVALKHLKKKGK